MNDIAMTLDLLWGAVLAASLAASAAALIALIAERLIARRAPSVAVFLWLLIGLRFLLPAAPASPWSIWNWIPAGESPSLAIVVGKSFSAPLGTAPSDISEPTLSEPLASPPAPWREAPPIAWPAAPVVAWLLGVVLLVGLRVERLRRFHRRLASSTFAPSQRLGALWEECRQRAGTRDVKLVVTSCVPGPAVFGLWRPAILLPVGFNERLTDDQVRMVLLHELLHVRRRDLITTALGEVVAIVHWFNPLAWLAARRLEAACESACDAAVLSLIGRARRTEYGRLIVEMIEEGWRRSQFQDPTSVVGSLALFGRRSQIQGRIDMILQGTSSSKWRRWSSWLGVAALVAVVLTDRGQVVAEDDPPRDLTTLASAPTDPDEATASNAAQPTETRVHAAQAFLKKLMATRKLSLDAAKETLLKEFMDPKIWETAQWDGDSLTLTATTKQHDEIARDLAVLGQSSEFYVCLEIRLLSVDEQFFERVGLDFDVVTKGNVIADRKATTTVTIDGKEYLWSGEDFENPRTRTSRVAFLQPRQCAAILNAVQSDPMANITAAPKVTLHNGQTAVCSCCEVRGNTSHFTAVKALKDQPDLKNFAMSSKTKGGETVNLGGAALTSCRPLPNTGKFPEEALFGWRFSARATHNDKRGMVRIEYDFSRRELPVPNNVFWWRSAGQYFGLQIAAPPQRLIEAYMGGEAETPLGNTLLLCPESTSNGRQTLLLITAREPETPTNTVGFTPSPPVPERDD